MFLNIKSKIMKQTQKYRQLSLFDNLTEGGGKSLEPFETPEEEQKPKRLKDMVELVLKQKNGSK